MFAAKVKLVSFGQYPKFNKCKNAVTAVYPFAGVIFRCYSPQLVDFEPGDTREIVVLNVQQYVEVKPVPNAASVIANCWLALELVGVV
tara:strand:- start:193 stop:456 length:264 start_codon:yes stop_codon:yes gene_type:complete